MTDYHLAQVNLAHLKEPLDSALLSTFVARINEINALADASPGFVWRYVGNNPDPAYSEAGDAQVIFTMSVWQDVSALHNYVYKTAHAQVFAQRSTWFHDWQSRLASSHMALWWIPASTRPTPAQAMAKTAHLLAHGPTAHAFTFKKSFDAQGCALFEA